MSGSSDLSYAENSEIYGKCARPNGHGHNYHLEITVKGEIDSRTGMIVDLGALQKVIEEIVIEPFDHTFLNKDISYFAKVIPTAENIALHISNLYAIAYSGTRSRPTQVKLIESPNNSCEVYNQADSGTVSTAVNKTILTQV